MHVIYQEYNYTCTYRVQREPSLTNEWTQHNFTILQKVQFWYTQIATLYFCHILCIVNLGQWLYTYVPPL